MKTSLVLGSLKIQQKELTDISKETKSIARPLNGLAMFALAKVSRD